GDFAQFHAGITPYSSPQGIVTGPDGNLWFTESIGRRIGRTAVVPAVTGVSPSSGPAAGGIVVTVSGTNFDPTPANNLVKFGSATATVQGCSPSGTQCTVTSPAGAAGATVDVTVTT